MWKKCRCLDLIDASYKLFPAIFFYPPPFFLVFFTVERGKKKLAVKPSENTAAGKNEARNNSVLGGITSEVVDKDGPQAGLAPRGRRSVGFTSVNGDGVLEPLALRGLLLGDSLLDVTLT